MLSTQLMNIKVNFKLLNNGLFGWFNDWIRCLYDGVNLLTLSWCPSFSLNWEWWFRKKNTDVALSLEDDNSLHLIQFNSIQPVPSFSLSTFPLLSLLFLFPRPSSHSLPPFPLPFFPLLSPLLSLPRPPRPPAVPRLSLIIWENSRLPDRPPALHSGKDPTIDNNAGEGVYRDEDIF